MDYYLYKLKFEGAVHFGQSDSALSLYTAADHFRADTLFSALCHTALSLWGEKGIEELIRQADADELLLSDSMPWRGEQFYLPKPCAVSKKDVDRKQDIPAEERKKIKKLAWIPVLDMMDTFADSIKGGKLYKPKEDAPFGITIERTSAAVFDGDDTRPYQVGAFRFYPDCGLYVLVGVKTKERAKKMDTLFSALGMSGIGGKVSSGYGSFTVEDKIDLAEPFDKQTETLSRALYQQENAEHLMLLTTSLPADDELEEVLKNANYQLVRRAGFVQSDSFAKTPMRKQMQYFMTAGAMLEKPFRGALYKVAENGGHSVVRYAKPMMLGVAF